MLQVDVQSGSKGNLKRECAVFPPVSRSAAIPLAATASAIFPLIRSLAKIFSMTKDFPVPPGPSRKKHSDLEGFCTAPVI